MGLEHNTRTIFLSIGDGKITRRVKEPTGSSKQRTTKEGKVVNEEIYDAVTGIITDIKVTTHDKYGKFWNVYLQMNYSGGYSSAFLKALPNVDLSARVKLIPSMKVVDGKKKVTLFINQHGKALKHFYTKENPNGLPQMVKTKFKGQEVWDDTDMMQFLEAMVNTNIIPKLPKSGAPVTDDTPGYEPGEDDELTLEAQKVKDKLPF
jgi:hypothetical protein